MSVARDVVILCVARGTRLQEHTRDIPKRSLNRDSVLERDPLERLASDGRLNGYRHTGFWECMDTYNAAVQLNDLWESERPLWKLWA